MDPLGNFLRIAPPFKGRGRLTRFWLQRERHDSRMRTLPGGAKIECDMSVPYESMVWLGREEEEDVAALGSILRRGETFVDCGANIGLWTLMAAGAVGGSGRVHAFEPNPATFEKLKRNIAANALGEIVTASCSACGAEEGETMLACLDEHNNSRIGTNSGKCIPVPVTTLDVAVKGRVHGIKIDVEGHEPDVLRGAMRILEESRPWVCAEFNSGLAGAARLGDWAAHQQLRRLGYACRPMAMAADKSAGALEEDWGLQGYCNLFYFTP